MSDFCVKEFTSVINFFFQSGTEIAHAETKLSARFNVDPKSMPVTMKIHRLVRQTHNTSMTYELSVSRKKVNWNLYKEIQAMIVLLILIYSALWLETSLVVVIDSLSEGLVTVQLGARNLGPIFVISYGIYNKLAFYSNTFRETGYNLYLVPIFSRFILGKNNVHFNIWLKGLLFSASKN